MNPYIVYVWLTADALAASQARRRASSGEKMSPVESDAKARAAVHPSRTFLPWNSIELAEETMKVR